MAPGGPGGGGRPEDRFDKGIVWRAEGGGLGGTECRASGWPLGRESAAAPDRAAGAPIAAERAIGGADGAATTRAGGRETGATLAVRARPFSARFPCGLASELEATAA
jgi:hypothetical protein